MIEYIKGKVLKLDEFSIIVEIGNFGLKILTPSNFNGEESKVYIYHQIKENEIVLYGFKTLKERDIFLKLININGVGVKQALKILKNFSVEEIEEAVKVKNIKLFQQVSGIGKKLAQRIILELTDSLEFQNKDDMDKELLEALLEFGYKKDEAKTVLKEIPKNLSIEERLKEALKLLSKNKFAK